MNPFEIIRATTIGTSATVTTTDLAGGVKRTRSRYLDSAATCLQLKPVADAMNEYLAASCANSHTTATATGRDTTRAIEEAHADLGTLMGYDPAKDSVIFMGSGATQALCFVADAIADQNKGQRRPYAVVSMLEHHSNMLPWRRCFKTLFVRAELDGTLSMSHLRELLRKHRGEIAVVAVTAASNVTGATPPLGEIATLAHAAGAPLVVDAAQGAAHIPISKAGTGIDFVVGSGHKMYAPGSPGWLIAPTAFFSSVGDRVGALGGGSVDRVTLERVELKADPTGRYEAGTPNLPGIVGLGTACRVLAHIGTTNILEHERALGTLAMAQLQTVPELVIYGPPDAGQKTAVVTFNVGDLPHGLVASTLGDFFAIQTRNGCFCAEPYVRQQIAAACEARGFCKPTFKGKSGMVRASFGLYSDESDVAALAEALRWIAANGEALRAQYVEGERGAWSHRTFRSETGFDYRPIADSFLSK